MLSTIWKLTAVAGVLGIGTLVVLQAQRGLNGSGDETQLSEFDEDFVTPGTASEEPDLFESESPQSSPFDEDPPAYTQVAESQFEPQPADQFEPQADNQFEQQPAEPTLADPGDSDPFAQDSFGEQPELAQSGSAFESDPTPAPLDDSTPQVPDLGSDDPFAANALEPEPDPALNQEIVTAGHDEPTTDGGPRMLAPNPLGQPIEPEQTPTPGELEPSPFGDEPQTVEVPAWDDDPQPAPLGVDDGAPAFGSDLGQEEQQQDTPQPEPVDSLLGAPPVESDEPEYASEEDLPEPDPTFGVPEELPSNDEPLLLDAETPTEMPIPQREELTEEQPIQEVGGEISDLPESDDPPLDPTPETPQTLTPEESSEPIEPPENDYLQGEATVHQSAPRGSQRPQLQIEKIAPGNAVLGQPLVYNIVVRNHGQSAAHQVVVKDSIPAGSRLSGTIPRAELVDKQLLWKLGTIDPGEERTIKIRVVPTAEGQIGSIATVNFVAEVAAQTMITAPKIDFDLLGPPQARLGEPVVFRFRVANNGSGHASGVVIRNLLPDELKHAGGNDLEYEVGDLPAGKSMEVKLTLKAAGLGQAVNRATLTAAGGLSRDAQAAIEIVGSNLKISRTGPEKRFLGRPAEYTNTIVNESDVAARTITVVESVPLGFDFVASTDGGRYDPARRMVVWRIDGIGPHDTRDLKVKLLAKEEGTQKSLVTLVDSTGSRKEVTSETTVVGFTNVGLQLSPIDSPIEVGGQITLKVRARNSGTNPATNVQISLTLPDGLEPVSIEGPAQYTQNGRELRFDQIARIEGGRDAVIDLVLIAADPGNGRLHFELHADDMESPLVREEPIYVTE